MSKRTKEHMNIRTKKHRNKRTRKLLGGFILPRFSSSSVFRFLCFSVFLFICLYIYMFICSNAAMAADSPETKSSLAVWLGDLYVWAIGLGGALAIFMIAFAAIDYASSGGDVEKMNGAKEKIVGAVMGLLLLVLTYLIVNALHTEDPNPSTTTTPSVSDRQKEQQTYERSTEGVQSAEDMMNKTPIIQDPHK